MYFRNKRVRQSERIVREKRMRMGGRRVLKSEG